MAQVFSVNYFSRSCYLKRYVAREAFQSLQSYTGVTQATLGLYKSIIGCGTPTGGRAGVMPE